MSSTSTTKSEASRAVGQLLLDTIAGNALTNGFEAFLPNENSGSGEDGDEPWFRLSLQMPASTQDTLGPKGCRKFERTGIAFIQVFTPEDEGTDRSDRIVEVLQAGFEGERIPNTTVCFLDFVPGEERRTGKWYQVTIEANFEYTEIK